MPTMATETERPGSRTGSVSRANGSSPSSWGLGDGAAIPWEYAPAPESRDVVTIKERYGLFIGGKDVAASDGQTFTTINPATEEPLAQVARATPADMDKAVRAARTAFRKSWGRLAGRERAKYLFRIARILQERSREFAVLESMDSGKPIKESRDVDVPLAAAHFWYYAGWADKLEYAFPGRVAKPLGVAAQIIPWNFPLLMLAWKIAPALAAGNTVVLKPASTTPLSALLFADVCRQADLPPGVVNIIPGPGEVGMALVTHPGVDKVAFTGSTDIGKKIAKGVAGTDKALTLELGGKAANIVFDDAPLDQAVEGIVNGIYFNQGEVCCAGSRLLVQESIVEPLIEKLKDRLATIRVGDPLDKNTDVGAINSKAAAREDHGARRGRQGRGRRLVPAGLRPARIAATSSGRRSSRTSPRATGSRRRRSSGRCCRVLTFRTPDEAVEKANNTPYGLSAGIWTDKGSRILRDGPEDEGRRRLGEHVQPLRPDLAVRRLQGVGLRPRGRHARPPRLRPPRGPVAPWPTGSTSARRTSSTSAARSRAPNRAGRTSSAPPTTRRSPTRAGRRARTSATPSGPPARRSRAGPTRRAMNRGQVLYRVAELMEGRREQFAAEVATAEGLRDATAREVVTRAIDRWVWYAGWADKIAQVLGSSNPVAATLLQLHDPRADRRRRRRRVGGVVAAGPRVAAGAAARRGQHGRRPRLADAAAAGGHADGGPRDVATSRAASSTS